MSGAIHFIALCSALAAVGVSAAGAAAGTAPPQWGLQRHDRMHTSAVPYKGLSHVPAVAYTLNFTVQSQPIVANDNSFYLAPHDASYFLHYSIDGSLLHNVSLGGNNTFGGGQSLALSPDGQVLLVLPTFLPQYSVIAYSTASFQVLWHHTFTYAVDTAVFSSDGSTVFLAKYGIHCLDVHSGAELWRDTSVGGTVNSMTLSSGGVLHSAELGGSASFLVARSAATGAELYTTVMQSDMFSHGPSHLLLYDTAGIVYVAADSGIGIRFLAAYNASSGDELQRFSNIATGEALALSATTNALLAGNGTGFVALSLTSHDVLWSAALPARSGTATSQSAAFLTANDAAYVVNCIFDNGVRGAELHSIEGSSGKVHWTVDLPGLHTFEATALGPVVTRSGHIIVALSDVKYESSEGQVFVLH